MELTAVDIGGNLDVEGHILLSHTFKTIPSHDASKVHFNVRDPIESFTGREDYLTDLHQLILRNREDGILMTVISQTSVVTGLGGVGKTETVRKYIQRYGGHYKHIVWVDSEQKSIAETQFKKLATQELKLPLKYKDNKQKPFNALIKEIYQELCQDNNLLLIVFDNAEGLEDTAFNSDGIRRFLPQSLPPSLLQPAILVTSRNREWGLEKVIQLDVWSEEECIVFVLKVLELKETDKNVALARKLGERFGRLPLAMQVAVGIIRQQSKSKQLPDTYSYGIKDILDDYDKGMREVLENKPFDSSTSKMTMMVLWNISLRKIEKQKEGELAILLLQTMSYLSPVAIPKELICGLCHDEFFGSDWFMNKLADALLLLTGYSLVENCGNHFAIHRMIQDVIVTTMEHNIGGVVEHFKEEHCSDHSVLFELSKELTLYLLDLSKTNEIYEDVMENAIQVANIASKNLFTCDENKNWLFLCTELIAMQLVETQTEYASTYLKRLIDFCLNSSNGAPSRKIHGLQLLLAVTLRLQGKYIEALESLSLLFQEQKEMFGLSDIHTLETKQHIAMVLYDQGKYDEAMKFNLEVLELEEKYLGSTHSHTLSTMHNIASVLNQQGRSKDALELYSKVLNLQKHTQDSKSSTILILKTKCNIASVKSDQGRYNESLEEFKEVLNMAENLHGNNHIFNSTLKHNMALVLQNQGRYDEALKLCSEVLKRDYKILGSTHPDVLKTKNCVANILDSQGNYDGASEIYKEIMEGQTVALGAYHISTLTTRSNLGSCLCKQGKYDDALEIFKEVTQNMSQALDGNHPHVWKVQSNVAFIMYKKGDYDEALKMYLEVLKAEEEILGSNHPTTIKTKHNIALAIKDMGKLDDALKQFLEVLQLGDEVLGKCHPTTLATKHEIALVYNLQGMEDEALKLFSEVLDAQMYSLGPNDPSTLTTKANIAALLGEQGKYEDALKMNLEVLEVREKHLGLNHPNTLGTKNNIAFVLINKEKYEEALVILKDILVIWEKDLGSSHPSTIKIKINIATALRELEKYEDAMNMYVEILNVQRKVFGCNHSSTLKTKFCIAAINYYIGEYTKAHRIVAEVMQITKDIYGTDFPGYDCMVDLYEKSLSEMRSRRWLNWCLVFLLAGVITFSVRRRLK